MHTSCPHCGAAFTSQLGADTEAGRYCNACGQYEGFPDANGVPISCPRCGDGSACGAMISQPDCPLMRERDRQPQGEAVRLFEPAPTQLPGQTSLSTN